MTVLPTLPALALALAAMPLTAQQAPEPGPLAAYLACAETARTRALGPGEARTCSLHYLAVKLSFVPDVDPAGYPALAPHAKARANAQGYAGWSAWRDANPGILDAMKTTLRTRPADTGL